MSSSVAMTGSDNVGVISDDVAVTRLFAASETRDFSSTSSSKGLRRYSNGSVMSATEAYVRPSMRQISSGREQKPVDASKLRRTLKKIIEHRAFYAMVATVILVNVAVIISETNIGAQCLRGEDCTNKFHNVNIVILVFYVVELLVRLYAYRSRFFRNIGNNVDLGIVILGCIDTLIFEVIARNKSIPQVGFLRLFRILRIVRFSRLLSVSPELLSMVRGFAKAMAAMMYGFAMLIVMLGMFAIVAVEFVYPLAYKMAERGEDFEDCAQHFSDVSSAVFLFFQTLVAGDSWGTCAMPLIREAPWVFTIFGFSLVCVQLGLTNLILSTVVESAYKARERDGKREIHRKLVQEKKNVRRMLDIMKQMDTDDSGAISFFELEKGYYEIDELRDLFHKLELEAKDLQFLFHVMDSDGDGRCTYAEFIEMIQKTQDQDVKLQLMFVKLQLSQIALRLERHFDHGIEHLQQHQRDEEAPVMSVPAPVRSPVDTVHSIGKVPCTESEGDAEAVAPGVSKAVTPAIGDQDGVGGKRRTSQPGPTWHTLPSKAEGWLAVAEARSYSGELPEGTGRMKDVGGTPGIDSQGSRLWDSGSQDPGSQLTAMPRRSVHSAIVKRHDDLRGLARRPAPPHGGSFDV